MYCGFRGEMRPQFGERSARIRGQFKEGCGQSAARGQRGTEHYEEDGKRKQRLRLLRKVRDAVANSRVHHRVSAKGIRNGFLIPFEEQLVHPIIFVEKTQRRFEPFGESVDGRLVEALVVDSFHFKHYTGISGLRQKHLRAGEAKEVDHGVQRAGFLIVSKEATQVQHEGSPMTVMGANLAGSYCRRSFAARKRSLRI